MQELNDLTHLLIARGLNSRKMKKMNNWTLTMLKLNKKSLETMGSSIVDVKIGRWILSWMDGEPRQMLGRKT